MLQGKPVSQASEDATHCAQHHRISHRDGNTYTFWNTADLNESSQVKNSHDAVQDIQGIVDEYNFNLLIYCIEDGLVDRARFNYDLVWRDVCKEKVPIVLVVTGLKGNLNGDEWWHKNEDKIKEMKMSFDGHVCTSWRDRNAREYRESAEKLWGLVKAQFGLRHTIILFGETGAGKSSIVNLIVGKDVAKVSSALRGCTFKNDAYKTTIGDKRFVIYDTAGLNEGEQGRVPHWQAIRELYILIRELDGVSLLIYCMRGRVRENAGTNWNLFNKVICGGKVPIIVVVTGLETYEDPDDLLKDENSSDVFKRNRMEPKDVGCIVSIRGKQNQYAETYAKSQLKVRTLITKHCLQKSWNEEKDKWFAAIYSEAYDSGICFTTRSRLDYSKQMRDALDEFIRETGMRQDDTEKLRGTLVMAEKKFRRRLLRGLFK